MADGVKERFCYPSSKVTLVAASWKESVGRSVKMYVSFFLRWLQKIDSTFGLELFNRMAAHCPITGDLWELNSHIDTRTAACCCTPVTGRRIRLLYGRKSTSFRTTKPPYLGSGVKWLEKVWILLPGQIERCKSVVLLAKADRYIWGRIACTSLRFLHCSPKFPSV